MDEDGRAVVLLPHGVLFRGAAEEVIRKHLIQKLNVLDAVIGLPANLFFGTGIPVCVLVLKRERNGNADNILFIDARTLGDGGANEDGYVQLTETDKQKIASTLFAWQSPDWQTLYHDVPEFCYSATMDEIRSKDWSLYTSDYIKFIDRDFEIDYQSEIKKIQANLRESTKRQRAALAMLESAMEGISYGID